MKHSFCACVQTETRRLTCLILIVASLIASSACRQTPGGAPAAAAPCEVALAAHSGDAKIDREIARLQQEIRSNAKPFQTTAMIEKLGWSFVEKARESFDPGFYKLAEQCALCLESKQGEDRRGGQSADRPLSTPQSIRSAALLLRGHALHNLHRFSEAEKIARELVEARGLAYDLGLLGDVLIEQGKTDEAALAYQKMMDMRPGPHAYSRAAHLRWLKGDTEGARALMLMSAQAAGQTESAAWAWSKLAIYELQAGDMKRAHAVCDAALQTRPDYAPALLARGRVLLAENRTGEAVVALEHAARLNPLPEYQWALADALRAANRDDDAVEVERRLAATGPANDPRSYSLFLATRGQQPDVALRLAEEELKVRRDVYTLDALAWAQSAKGDAAEGWKTMRSALAPGTADARLYLHAAEIAAQAGENRQARIYAGKAAKSAFSLLPSETILQSYLGVVNDVDDANQNLTQTYTVRKIDNRTGHAMTLGRGVVPPNNQGNATPFYNEGDNGENPARKGVATAGELDRYTQQSIAAFPNGYTAFAGQRDDGFYADVQSIFDLLRLRNPGKDSQGGFNLHMMALRVPLSELGGDQQTIGVFATTSRLAIRVQGASSRGRGLFDLVRRSLFVQVARQGNPLFNEGLVALEDKDTYSRTLPTIDGRIFRKYAENPELAALINLLIGGGQQLAIPTGRADIAAIFIPDLIKVDLSTDPVRLAGNGPGAAGNPDDMGFSRLSIFGGDILESRAAGHPFRLRGEFLGMPAGKFFVPGGWPNGRRFGDDVVDIAIIALLSDLRDPANLKINDPFMGNYDGVTGNELGFNKVFPYESTPQNGRKIVGFAQ